MPWGVPVGLVEAPDPLLLLLAGLALDAFVTGLPDSWRRIPHPVVLAGRAIAWAEARLNRPQRSVSDRVWRGLFLCAALVLLAGGFFRSLQFTSLNGLAYAEIEQDRMSRASTMSAMAQQLIQSVGIGLAATLIHLFTQMSGKNEMTAQTISPAFLVIGALTFVSLIFYVRLPKNAGDEMNSRS